MTPEDRGRLRALAEKATKGPWVADGIGSDGSWEIWSAAESQHGSIICSRNGWDHRAAESRANVRLIVEAVKALPKQGCC